MKEAEVMKVLSVSGGVAEKDIVLDESPRNTHEMIAGLRKMADLYGWHSAIIVSSPYHMLRLRLVCEKELKGIKTYLVPVEKSGFYDHRNGASPSQFVGILHEYLSIIYYKLKGYI
jgi:uncharacterized SAM-binding protein YcdF (DUF218 family)